MKHNIAYNVHVVVFHRICLNALFGLNASDRTVTYSQVTIHCEVQYSHSQYLGPAIFAICHFKVLKVAVR